nr:kinase family protein [Ipomoea batatas]
MYSSIPILHNDSPSTLTPLSSPFLLPIPLRHCTATHLASEFQEYANSRSSTDLLLNPFQFQVSIGPPFKMRLVFLKDDLESSTGQSLDGKFQEARVCRPQPSFSKSAGSNVVLLRTKSALVPYENTSDHHGEIVELEHHHKLKARKQGSRLGLKQGEIVLLEDPEPRQKQFQVHEPLAEDCTRVRTLELLWIVPAESLTLHFGAQSVSSGAFLEDMSLCLGQNDALGVPVRNRARRLLRIIPVLEERDSPAMNLQFSSAHALQHGKLCPSSDTESLVYLIYFICGGTMPQQDSIESALQWRQRSWAKRMIQHRLGEVSALLKAFADYIDSLCGTPYPVDYDVWLRRLNHGSADRGKRIEDDVVGTEDMGDYSGRNSS